MNEENKPSAIRSQFKLAANSLCRPVSDKDENKKVSDSKSYAQVAGLVAPRVSPRVAPNPIAGHSPRPRRKEKRTYQSYGVKLKTEELELIRAKAAAIDMTVNAYIRATALGEDYIPKPPPWQREQLLKLYVELAAQGRNLNQLARSVNSGHISAEAALLAVDRQRAAMSKLFDDIGSALASGRRPPAEY